MINVYQNLHGDLIALEDGHSNNFTIVTREELGTYTWEEKLVEVNTKRATLSHYMRPRVAQKTSGMMNRENPIIEPMKHIHLSEPRGKKDASIDFTLPMEPMGMMRPKMIRGKQNKSSKSLRPSTLQ